MTDADAGLPPKGWYPDPSGAQQWRVWNGRSWSDVVRAFTEGSTPGVPSTEAVRAQGYLVRGGVVCFFGGIALLADARHHAAGLRASGHAATYDVLLAVGLVTLFAGHLAYVYATTTLWSRRRWVAAVPFLNSLAWATGAFVRASYPMAVLFRSPSSRRESVDGARLLQLGLLILLALYWYRPLPSSLGWSIAAHALPVVAAGCNLAWAVRFRDDLAARPISAPVTAQ